MTSRDIAVRSISVGDIFHAASPNGASLVCLALKVTDTTIFCRTVTSQYELEFDLTNGVAERDFHGTRVVCTIDSVASLPPDIRDTLLELDRIYSSEPKDEDHRLTDAERRALVFAAQYYPANSITPPGHAWETMGVDRKFAPAREPEDYDSLTGDQKIELILLNYLIPANRS